MVRGFHVTFQHDAMQCGVACLQMVCRHFGCNYSLDFLSQQCAATTGGVSLLALREAAPQLGLSSVCGRAEADTLADAPLPCILHWNQNHFVVLYRVKRNRKYYIADPGKGLVTYGRAEFLSHWISTHTNGSDKGVVMFLKPTPAFGQCKDNTVPPAQLRSFKFLLGYIRQYRRLFFQIVLGLAVGSVLQLALPFLTQSIVDVGIRNQDIGFVWLVLIGQLVLTLGQTSLDFIRRWLLLHVNMRINISLLSDFFIKLLRLPMSFFDTKLLGDLMQRMGDHSRVNSFLTQQTLSILFSAITFVVYSLVLCCYSMPVLAVFMVGILLYGAWMMLFLHRRKLLDYELFEKQAINSNKTYEFITSMQEIKLQNCEQRRRWEWEDVQADLFDVQMKSLKLQQTQEAGSIFINELKNMAVTVMAASAVIHGNITLGMMLAIQYVIGQLNSPVNDLLSFCYSLQDVKISLERINEIHRMADENGDSHTKTDTICMEQGIRLSHVDFKYDPHAPVKTIDQVSFTVPCGKVTAIVGASGSGKTTLIKLMLGYYPAAGGQLLIGDTDIATVDLRWWRRQCGVVMQNGAIFSESIARNIAVDDGDIDKDALLHAAEIACIKDYIQQLPLGFDTKIGRDGVGLSQGQRQRILIARAVYKNPAFIFLDEATNSLDANNERCIVENLDRFYHGKTVVVVAHRLSTVKNADQIVVLDGGRVVEVGTHDTLVKQQGAYYHLVKNQLELGA